ncbi:antiterminator Q family protein [Orbus wheelerorum]|uniref:antiterminator Q family protein n=1 Tax=Orbus wheelerorum TaxID=3074111 RepID=UPI00370DCD8F
MKRDIKQVLVAWANVRRSTRTGLEYPYKSPSIPVTSGDCFDCRPLLSESEAHIVDKAALRLAQIDPISYSILKSIYINKQSRRLLAKNINKSNDFICDQLKLAEFYILAKIDDVMDIII